MSSPRAHEDLGPSSVGNCICGSENQESYLESRVCSGFCILVSRVTGMCDGLPFGNCEKRAKKCLEQQHMKGEKPEGILIRSSPERQSRVRGEQCPGAKGRIREQPRSAGGEE